MSDALQTYVSVMGGGLVTNVDPLTQSNNFSGSAIRLINMEPSLDGGYRRISGFENSYGTLPGTGKVLGLAVNGDVAQGIIGCRKPDTSGTPPTTNNINYVHWYNHYYDVPLGTGEGSGFTVGETVTGAGVAASGTVVSKTADAIVVNFGRLPDTVFATGNVLTGADSSATGTVSSTPTVKGWQEVSTTVVANDPDGVCASQTPSGAGNLTINGALAVSGSVNFSTAASEQPRKVTITASTNESARTFTITGTDINGAALIQNVTGPNNTTVSSTSHFTTVTQIAVDAATSGAITVGSGDGGYRLTEPTFSGVDTVRTYNIFMNSASVFMTDGVNRASFYDGTNYRQIVDPNAPDKPKYASNFANHLWLAGDPDEPSIVYHSAPNTADITSFDSGLAAGFLDMGFEVTAIKAFRDQLYVFGQNQIKRITGTNISDWVVQDVTTDLGCVATDTVVEFGGDIIFLGPDGIRPISGTSRIGDVELETVSREIQNIFANYTANEDVTKLKTLIIRRKSQFRLFFEANTSLSLLAAIRKSPTAQSTFEFSQVVGIEATAVASGYIGQFEFVLHGDSNGKVHKQEEGDSFNTANILSVYQTPYYFMGDPEVRKIFYKVKTFLKTEGDATINVGIDFNFGDSEINTPDNFSVTTAGAASAFDDAATIYDTTDIYDGNPSPTRSTNISGSGDSISVSYVTNSTSPSHTIQAVSILYGTGDRR